MQDTEFISEYTPTRASIEGGYDLSDLSDTPIIIFGDDASDTNHVTYQGGLITDAMSVSKTASTVEPNLREMFGYVRVIQRKKPKIRIRKKPKVKSRVKPKKKKRARKVILVDDPELELIDDYEVARQIEKSASKGAKSIKSPVRVSRHSRRKHSHKGGDEDPFDITPFISDLDNQ